MKSWGGCVAKGDILGLPNGKGIEGTLEKLRTICEAAAESVHVSKYEAVGVAAETDSQSWKV
jgi:hypothetical protein